VTVDLLTADLDALRRRLTDLGRLVVAFSGGADSAFLAKVATDTLGAGNVLCATAVSPSLADEELADVRALVSEWKLRHLEVLTDELDDPLYRKNDAMRCARCKTALMDALEPVALAEHATVVLGVNLDDLGDTRPGQRAASLRGAVFPLVEAGFTKAALRAASRDLGLRTWDKPAAACLSSRIPYGTPVSKPILRAVADAEAGLRALGFRVVRVRHYGDLARIELGTDELPVALERRDEILATVRAAGYRYVTLDLEGFRSGNLNDALR
jgi:pyridinium-3,5-biscarboxylic acid mononucleotide sulfurtransferase